MNTSFPRAGARSALALAGAVGLCLAAASAASAHVTVTPDTTASGSYALLTFGVPHGCEGSSTTSVAIQIPEQITSVTPSVNPGWDVEKVMEPLDPPVTDAHGNELTERVDQVVYTARTPLPADLRDAFVLSVKIPEAAGETLVFPAVQTCEVGETAWVEVAEAGQDEPAHPAPSFEVTEAEGDGHDAAHADASAEVVGDSQAVSTSDAEPTSSGTGLAIAGLVAGVAGLVVGGVALARSRRA